MFNGYVNNNTRLTLKERWSMLGLFVVAFVGNFIAFFWLLFAIIFGYRNRSWRIMLSYDQVANAAFGGHEDETISSRAGKARSDGRRWGCYLCKLLDWLDKDHCANARETFIQDLSLVAMPRFIGTFPIGILEDPTWTAGREEGSMVHLYSLEGENLGLYVISNRKLVQVRVTIP